MLAAGSVVVIAVTWAALAWAQGGGFGGPPPGGSRGGGSRGGGPGGGGPGDMQAMTYLEQAWTAVCFQLDCSAEQQDSLRPTFATELQTRNEALEQAQKKRDMSAMQKALEACKSGLNARLKEVLADAQWDKLQKLTKPLAPPAGN